MLSFFFVCPLRHYEEDDMIDNIEKYGKFMNQEV